MNDPPTFYKNPPWFLGVAKAQISLGHAGQYCQESLSKGVAPEGAEELVILGES